MLFPVPSAWGAGPYFIHILFACASGEERKGGREDLAFNMRIINGGASPVMAAMSLILRRYCVPIPEGSGCGMEERNSRGQVGREGLAAVFAFDARNGFGMLFSLPLFIFLDCVPRD